MTAVSFPSKMMRTSITDDFCGAAYAFWKEICWKPTVYGEWWKHVPKVLYHFLGKAVGCEAFNDLSKEKALALTYTVFEND